MRIRSRAKAATPFSLFNLSAVIASKKLLFNGAGAETRICKLNRSPWDIPEAMDAMETITGEGRMGFDASSLFRPCSFSAVQICKEERCNITNPKVKNTEEEVEEEEERDIFGATTDCHEKLIAKEEEGGRSNIKRISGAIPSLQPKDPLPSISDNKTLTSLPNPNKSSQSNCKIIAGGKRSPPKTRAKKEKKQAKTKEKKNNAEKEEEKQSNNDSGRTDGEVSQCHKASRNGQSPHDCDCVSSQKSHCSSFDRPQRSAMGLRQRRPYDEGYYYYYSGFAPSCKRKRDREMEKRLEPSATPPVVDKPREDKEEDVVEEEELEMVMQVKKKIKSGRKPMKARSLNSLL
ncbi:uncharacterized protein LOC110007582 [Amborella trichopoda]|uniref:uncharacterized protein LOC110007582 n=1 Tax=Amborella trichopoda TaxID=13333 RepID=UPI0009C127CD|nr:uncharacterized protein LOC110007582 [Amborella trichopoda]|eukprot:XP_020524948.1 uncharacterized protein LOC110007582 [Amborella trichopoda]